MAKTLTEQQVVECVRKVLAREFALGDWVPVGSIYARLFANPARFGALDVHALPKYPRFKQICKAMFQTRRPKDELEMLYRSRG
jgi:hypothetical protein